jgi:DNA-binding response OmpR family regulator
VLDRRASDLPVAPFRVGDIEVDALHLRARRGSKDVRLGPAEHLLLYTLAARAGAVVSYQELTQLLGLRGDRLNAVARHISALRRKLGDDFAQPRYVETVHGVGYRVPIGVSHQAAT